MDWMTFLPPLVIYGFAYFTTSYLQRRKYAVLVKEYTANKKELVDLQKKNQLEQDLSLATTEQLLQQIQVRVPGFILITPVPTNNQKEQGLNVHIKGLPPQAAISCMKFACQVIATNAPQDGNTDFDFDVE